MVKGLYIKMINVNTLTKKEILNRWNFKCEHRHNGLTHPSCYLEGNLKICYFDLEATNLKATFGITLSTAVKQQDGNVLINSLPPNFQENGYDRQVIKRTIDILKQYNVVVTYYGTWFDIPFLRTRAWKLGLDFPKFGDIVHIDLYPQVKRLMSLQRRRLDNACAIFDIHGKTHLDPDIWIAAMCGDKHSLEYIIEHNKQDVIILEELHKQLNMYIPRIKKSI